MVVEPSTPILQTKLYRPPVTPDVVPRRRLHAQLDQGRRRSLTLVSAPAGYGKSTMVSHWLETLDEPHVWLSLDETDGDLRVFLTYVIAAVRTIAPAACPETLSSVNADVLPEVPALARRLINELDAIEIPFILALDDYYTVREPVVHELINELLEFPPRPLHLVLISRRDPPLPMSRLRARGALTEIRITDLRFTAAETAELLKASIPAPVAEGALERLHERAEGWIVGLRLAILSLDRANDVDSFLERIKSHTHQVQDYLVSEVLAHQRPEIQELLLSTSILDRFCAPLCDALSVTGSEPQAGALGGEDFIHWLEKAGLFCIPLDEQHEWFRYHHLFQEILQRRLRQSRSQAEVVALHSQASDWLEREGWIEEALHHALKGPGSVEAGQLIARQRHEIVNRELWHQLNRWLQSLPGDVIDHSPQLLMLQGWSAENRYRLGELCSVLDRIGSMLAAGAVDDVIRGEHDALSSFRHYLTADAQRAIGHAENALIMLPKEYLAERGYAMIILAAACQMAGELDRAHDVIHGAMADTSFQADTFQARLLIALCFVYWMEGDLAALQRTASRYYELGERHDLAETTCAARYFLGTAHYQQGDMVQAERVLASVASEEDSANVLTYSNGAFALAMIYQATGREQEARKLAERTTNQLAAANNSLLLPGAWAFEAEIALLQGRDADAVRWAQGYDPEPFYPMYQFRAPQLTLVKVFLAEDSVTSSQRAGELLSRMQEFVARTHNRRFLIEVLALEALLQDAEGDEAAALATLGRSISLAWPYGQVRVFADLGPALLKLLGRLEVNREAQGFVHRTLTAAQHGGPEPATGTAMPHRDAGPAGVWQPIIEPLSPRELEILGLLADRLSNKEIATRLIISVGTVKRHCENIYRKLDVRGRREAVAKALRLQILGDA